jgi:hypothetical protein
MKQIQILLVITRETYTKDDCSAKGLRIWLESFPVSFCRAIIFSLLHIFAKIGKTTIRTLYLVAVTVLPTPLNPWYLLLFILRNKSCQQLFSSTFFNR